MKHRAKLSSYPVSNITTDYLLPSLGQSSGGMLSNAAAEAERTAAVGFLRGSCLRAVGRHRTARGTWGLESTPPRASCDL